MLVLGISARDVAEGDLQALFLGVADLKGGADRRGAVTLVVQFVYIGGGDHLAACCQQLVAELNEPLEDSGVTAGLGQRQKESRVAVGEDDHLDGVLVVAGIEVAVLDRDHQQVVGDHAAAVGVGQVDGAGHAVPLLRHCVGRLTPVRGAVAVDVEPGGDGVEPGTAFAGVRELGDAERVGRDGVRCTHVRAGGHGEGDDYALDRDHVDQRRGDGVSGEAGVLGDIWRRVEHHVIEVDLVERLDGLQVEAGQHVGADVRHAHFRREVQAERTEVDLDVPGGVGEVAGQDERRAVADLDGRDGGCFGVNDVDADVRARAVEGDVVVERDGDASAAAAGPDLHEVAVGRVQHVGEDAVHVAVERHNVAELVARLRAADRQG